MSVLTYFFCSLLIISSALVVVSRNPLYSILFLITSFFSASILLFLIENEFLALFFLIIYLGAIAILFLFVIMMLDIKYNQLQNSKIYFPLGLLIGLFVGLETYNVFFNFFSKKVFYKTRLNYYYNWYDNSDSLSDIYVIGQFFYTHYTLHILIAGLILYVAVLGVAFLTIKSAYFKTKVKNQFIFKQLSRTKNL